MIEEACAEDDAAAYLEAMQKFFPNESFEKFEFLGGKSAYLGNSPFTNTHGFGTLPNQHDESLLAEIESFFKKKNCSSILSVASVAPQEVLRLLYNREYRITAFRNMYVYSGYGNPKSEKEDTSIEIQEASSPSRKKVWLKVVADSFAGKELEQPDPISLGQSVKRGNRFFVAYLNGVPAGASALYVDRRFARLGGMGTLAQFRGHGIQQAMIRHRMNLAFNLGCDLIISDTQPGNRSQRNLERCGFKLAYVRGIYRRAL